MLKDGILRLRINLKSWTSSLWWGLVLGRYAVEGEPRETVAENSPLSSGSKGIARTGSAALKSLAVTKFAPAARAYTAISPGPSHSAFWTTRMLGFNWPSSEAPV